MSSAFCHLRGDFVKQSDVTFFATSNACCGACTAVGEASAGTVRSGLGESDLAHPQRNAPRGPVPPLTVVTPFTPGHASFQKQIHATEVDDCVTIVERIHPKNPADSGTALVQSEMRQSG